MSSTLRGGLFPTAARTRTPRYYGCRSRRRGASAPLGPVGIFVAHNFEISCYRFVQ
jgi:hypothetical protein